MGLVREVEVVSKSDIAIVVGGSAKAFEEFEAARAMVRAAGKTYEVFVVNDMIAAFPEFIDHAITLHPEKFSLWASERLRAGRPGLSRIWAHRPFEGSTDSTQDWNGSVSLLAVKCARTVGYTHVICAGCPMTVEDCHFRRVGVRWNAAHGFRRGWDRYKNVLKPYVRSMSGWTQELLGAPTLEWLNSVVEEKHRVRHDPPDLKA